MKTGEYLARRLVAEQIAVVACDSIINFETMRDVINVIEKDELDDFWDAGMLRESALKLLDAIQLIIDGGAKDAQDDPVVNKMHKEIQEKVQFMREELASHETADQT